jgi:hypothetical protein
VRNTDSFVLDRLWGVVVGFDFGGLICEGFGLEEVGLEDDDFAVVGRVVGCVVGLAVVGLDEDGLPLILDLSILGFIDGGFRGDGIPEECFDDGCLEFRA